MIVCIIAFSSATSVSALNCRKCVAWRARSERRGSATISRVPFFTAFLIQVAATGWFTVGFAPISSTTSACITSITGFDTAAEPMPSSSAATLDAWHSRVQWSTLFEPKPVRTSFWNRYASSLLPFAEPKPGERARTARVADRAQRRRSRAPSPLPRTPRGTPRADSPDRR